MRESKLTDCYIKYLICIFLTFFISVLAIGGKSAAFSTFDVAGSTAITLDRKKT
jgi:hypothetical protein